MIQSFPKEIGDQIEGSFLVHKETMAGVTFYITEDRRNGMYRLFSESRKRPLQECHPDETDPYYNYFSYEEAVEGLAREQANLEQVLKNKRDDMPTPRQLFFLFSEKMPIPVGLTWGQASDLIDGRLAAKKREHEQVHAKRFNGLVVGMRVKTLPPYKPGDTGEITKLTSNNRNTSYAYVKFDSDATEGSGHVLRCDIRWLQRIDG